MTISDLTDSMNSLERHNIAVVFGTRPEIIKLAPVIKELGKSASLIHTGQHYDQFLSERFIEDFRLPQTAVQLDVGGMSRGAQIGRSVYALDEVLSDKSAVIVQGDTNSALAGALAANASEIFLGHVESGLRSYDRRMPEEHNRRVIDHLADILWAPTAGNKKNLLAEGISENRILVTGNSIIEALDVLIPPKHERREYVQSLGLKPGEFITATLHRPENVDGADRLAQIIEMLGSFSIPVLLAIHPRTQHRIEEFQIDTTRAGLRLVEPLSYASFLSLVAESALIISDSGGVQEEVSVLKVPLVVIRHSTERPEVLGRFAWLESDPELVFSRAQQILTRRVEIRAAMSSLRSPYGDGTASQQIVESLVQAIQSNVEERLEWRARPAEYFNDI